MNLQAARPIGVPGSLMAHAHSAERVVARDYGFRPTCRTVPVVRARDFRHVCEMDFHRFPVALWDTETGPECHLVLEGDLDRAGAVFAGAVVFVASGNSGELRFTNDAGAQVAVLGMACSEAAEWVVTDTKHVPNIAAPFAEFLRRVAERF